MNDFWRSSGYGLLARDADGWLAVTDDFLRAYLHRPEMRPVAESCAAEIELHAALLADPRLDVPAQRVGRIADADARDNYTHFLAYRDRLIAAGTVERCYLDLFRAAKVVVAPLFVDQMAHVILRNVLDGCADAVRVRAAELLFRSQKVTIVDGTPLAADAETVEMHRATGGLGDLGRLLAAAEVPTVRVELDVLGPDNAALYWPRSDRYDTVLDLGFARPGLDALSRVLEGWVRHFLAVEVSIQPVRHIRDRHWAWHVGLDAEASAILNDLYRGRDIGEDRLRRLISLFRLEFREPAVMAPEIAGRPVYLAMATDGRDVLRLKPQNLLVNLPLAGAV